MSEFVYKDYLPLNARVIVDYTKEQKVAFSYPIKWSYQKAVWKMAYPTVVSWWSSLHILPFVYILPFIFVVGLPFILIRMIFFPYSTTSTTTRHFDFFHLGLPGSIGFFYLLGIPAIITFILSRDKEKLSKYIPKMGYFVAKTLSSTKEIIVEPNKIHEDKFIIPAFKNIFLNYKCTKDFNKYLKKIEVLEIPFNFKIRRFFLPFLKKKERNSFVFRAVFYFSQQPQEGNMEIEFI